MPAPLVYITGASSGIGQALAARYHRAGWRLALVARRIHEIESWASACEISADSYQIYSADVSCIQSIVDAGQACLQRQGVPDVVIANACPVSKVSCMPGRRACSAREYLMW